MKISEVKEILAGEPDPDQVAELAADERSGVQKLVVAYHKRQEKLRLEQQRFTEMLAYERKYYTIRGHSILPGSTKQDGDLWQGRW